MLLARSSFCLKRTLPFIYSRSRLIHSSTNIKQKEDRPKEYELRVGYGKGLKTGHNNKSRMEGSGFILSNKQFETCSIAIATLQDDIPHFFQKGLTGHSIYSHDIILSDPHYTKLSIHGRTPYLGIAQMLKWSTSLYFDTILLEITRMRVLPTDIDIDNYDDTDDDFSSFSSIDDMENDVKSKGIVRCLEVRWKLRGTKNPTFFQPEPRIRHIEGVFIYKFDHQGYIGEHRIQRIVPPPSRRVLLMHSLGVRLRSLFWEKRPPILNPGF